MRNTDDAMVYKYASDLMSARCWRSSTYPELRQPSHSTSRGKRMTCRSPGDPAVFPSASTVTSRVPGQYHATLVRDGGRDTIGLATVSLDGQLDSINTLTLTTDGPTQRHPHQRDARPLHLAEFQQPVFLICQHALEVESKLTIDIVYTRDRRTGNNMGMHAPRLHMLPYHHMEPTPRHDLGRQLIAWLKIRVFAPLTMFPRATTPVTLSDRTAALGPARPRCSASQNGSVCAKSPEGWRRTTLLDDGYA